VLITLNYPKNEINIKGNVITIHGHLWAAFPASLGCPFD